MTFPIVSQYRVVLVKLLILTGAALFNVLVWSERQTYDYKIWR